MSQVSETLSLKYPMTYYRSLISMKLFFIHIINILGITLNKDIFI